MNKYLSLKDHVYNYVLENIKEGNITSADKLIESKISEELKVSRTPIREALIQLASDGYLEALPRKGFKVKEIDTEATTEMYNVMGPLDARAAFLSTDKLNAEDYSYMDFLCNSMDSAIENMLFDKYNDLQNEFHNMYIKKCGNAHLIEIILQVRKMFVNKSFTVKYDKLELVSIFKATNKEHYTIMNLMKNGKAKEVQEYIRDIHWNEENAKYEIGSTRDNI